MDPRTQNGDLMAEQIENSPPSDALDLIATLGSKTDLAALGKGELDPTRAMMTAPTSTPATRPRSVDMSRRRPRCC